MVSRSHVCQFNYARVFVIFLKYLIQPIQIYFSRYYYADYDKTREKVKNMIRDKEWNTDEFSEIKQDLLKKLMINNS